MLFCNLITSLFLLIMQFRVYPRHVLEGSSSCCPLSWSGPQLGFHLSRFSKVKPPQKKILRVSIQSKSSKSGIPVNFPTNSGQLCKKWSKVAYQCHFFVYKSREASDLWSFTSVHRAGLMSFCQLNAQPGQFIFWTSPVGERGIATHLSVQILCVSSVYRYIYI